MGDDIRTFGSKGYRVTKGDTAGGEVHGQITQGGRAGQQTACGETEQENYGQNTTTTTEKSREGARGKKRRKTHDCS